MSSIRTSFPGADVTKDPLSVLNGRLQPYGTEIERDLDYLLYTSQNNGARHLYYDLSYTSNFPFLPSGTLSYAKDCTIVEGYENCNLGVYESETTTYCTENVTASGNTSSGYDVNYIISDNEGLSFTFILV